uniref:Iodothyronine deiodinase n=1 Tax=Gasterosteus aculeatus aculeatus TaxID=481459 RepID=G3PEJ4_GASAC
MAWHRLMVYLSTAGLFCFMMGINVLLFISHLISPSLTKKIILKLGERVTTTQNPNFKYEDWGLTFSSFAFVKTASQHMWLSLGQDAFVGGEAPDTLVVNMEGKQTSICNYFKGNRPLFKQLVKDFGDVADFLVVYVAEAHSTDGWAFANNIDINQHKTLEDRLSAAQILVEKEPLCPVVVDDMSNVSAIKYGALPERLYVLQAGKVAYKGTNGPWGYNPMEVRTFLEKNE